jgi:hypothetical protein
MQIALAVVFMLGALLFALVYSNLPSTPAASTAPIDVDRCITRGVEYFRSTGSYPTLSDGRNAFNVARERCQRTTTAFP